MLCLEKLFRKWAFISLLQLVLIQNIYANTNDIPLLIVAIKIKRSLEWSYGSLITERAVLTAAEVVVNVHKNDLTIMKNCEILHLQYSAMEMCLERTVLNINLLENPNADNNFQSSVAVLILESPFNQEDNIIKIVERFDDIDQNNCFFISWDFVETQKSMVTNTITSLYKVSFLKEKSDIGMLIKGQLTNVDIDYAISNVTIKFLQTQNGHKVILDRSKDFLGNPLICALKTNSSNYVQIGVAAGYLTLQHSNDIKLIIGRYYVDIRNQRSQLIKLAERKNNSSLFVESIFNDLFSISSNLK